MRRIDLGPLASIPLLLLFGFSFNANTEPCQARTCNGQRQACIASEARQGRTDQFACANAYTLCLKSGVWGNPAGAAVKSCAGLRRH